MNARIREKKHRARGRRRERRYLVHLAGCTLCRPRFLQFISRDGEDYDLVGKISVPRSLRAILGRYISPITR